LKREPKRRITTYLSIYHLDEIRHLALSSALPFSTVLEEAIDTWLEGINGHQEVSRHDVKFWREAAQRQKRSPREGHTVNPRS
jgi:inactivated superfamily I helicase